MDPKIAARAERFNIPIKAPEAAPAGAKPAAVAKAPPAPKVVYTPRELTAEEQAEYEKLEARALKFGVPNTAGEAYKKKIQDESIQAQAQAARKAKQEEAKAIEAAKREEAKAAEAVKRAEQLAKQEEIKAAQKAKALAAEEDKKRKRQEQLLSELTPEMAAQLEARAKRFAPSAPTA